ncbi:MAG TPA: hypothetical protein VLK84_08905 [Longimicrobium sp.]|nr:hypothetical protein [Longimicrobium sp.]
MHLPMSSSTGPILPASRSLRWMGFAACAWAVLFGAPHAWWALGISAGFPGGEANYHRFMSSTWRYIYDVVVVVMSGAGVWVAWQLMRPPAPRRWIARTAAWIASGMLTLRGVAGMVVDGAADPVWWPTFLVGGILFGGVAVLSRRGRAAA